MTQDFDAAAPPDSGIFGLDTPASDAKIILIPVPFDATTSYGRRTAQGPQAILQASHQVDLFDHQTGRPYQAGIHMLPEDEQIASWNKRGQSLADATRSATSAAPRQAAQAELNQLGEKVAGWLHNTADAWLGQRRIVGVVGGDHSTPLGLIEALAQRHPKMGILHIDAHADLRDAYEGFTFSHASIMFNVLQRTKIPKLVQVGVRDFGEGEVRTITNSRGRVTTFFDQDLASQKLRGVSFAKLAASIVKTLPKEVYISFDIDGLDPTLCPNTGTPVPGGLSFHEACMLLETVVASGRVIIGFDLNEVGPSPQGDEWDANVGARILYKLCGFALKSQNLPGKKTVAKRRKRP